MSKSKRRKNVDGTTNLKGQYKLNHIVRCDRCRHEFKPLVKELEYDAKTKIIVSGFICNECNQRYIVSVTDNALRKNMSFASDLEQEIIVYKRHIKHEYDTAKQKKGCIPQDIADRLNKHLSELEDRYNKLIKSNVARGKELKDQYLSR